MSTASALRHSSKIALACVIRQELVTHIVALTPLSPDLLNTRDEVLEALSEDIEIHIHNDGFRQGIEMYFASLIKRLTLISELSSIKSNTEVQANLVLPRSRRRP